jgi:general secretion pathway protein K
MTGRTGERGAALVVTLVFAAAMAATAVAFIGARQSDAVTMRAQAEAIQAQAMLQAALNQTVAVLANKTSRQIVPKQLSWVFEGVQVRVTLESEAGKVDINKAEEPLLRALPMALGLRDGEASALADAILDWRDENKLKRPNGAEDREYGRGERGATGAANRPFAHPAELRYLPSVNSGVWNRLAPLITVYSGTDSPERTKAPPQVQRAVTIAAGLAPSRDEQSDMQQEQSQDDRTGGGRAGATADGASASERAGRLAPAAGGQGSSLTAEAGRSDFTRRSQGQGEDAETAAEAREATRAGHDTTGTQTVVVDVRFPNGYEAAARAVIGLDPSAGGSEPFLMLDWTPFIPDQSGKP